MSNVPPVQPNPGFSNYPRGGPVAPGGGGGFIRPPGIYFDSIGEAWRMIMGNLGGWIVIILCFAAIQYGVSLPLSFVGNMVAYGNMFGSTHYGSFDIGRMMIAMAISSLGYLITLPVQTGLQFTAVRAVRGWAVGPGDLWVAFPMIGQVLLGWLIMGILHLGGFLLLIIPGFYVMGVLAFVQLLIVDRRMTAMQAVEASYVALKSHGWAMFGLMFVVGLCQVLGFCACFVGVLFTAPLTVLVPALIYNNFFPPVDQYPQGHAIGIEAPRSWG